MAYDDIATLGIKADTSNLSKAIAKLEELKNSAEKTETATERFSKQCQANQRAMDATAKSASGLASSMANAAKNIIAAVAAYKGLDAIKSIATRGLEFNSAMEKSKISIGVLVATMTKLEDAQGNVLTGMDKYAAAQGIAADMMNEIQRLGLETTATTQELVEGMQLIMSPAIKAGMALKDIPQFATSAAQALQTIGLPLQQLRTELDALLTGNVSKAQDVLAPALFSDIPLQELGEHLRKLKESGELIPEITKRLQYFRLAGQDVSQTLTGLASNVDEAFDVIAGNVTANMFESFKQVLQEVQGLLINTDGKVGIGQDFEHIALAIEKIQTALAGGVVDSVSALVSGIKDFNSHLGDTGVSVFFSDIERGAKVAVAALAALVVARKAAAAQFTVGRGESAQQVTGLGSYVADTWKKNEAERQAALAARQTAVAELEKFRATQQSAVATRNAQAASVVRAAMLKQEAALLANVTAAEARLAATSKVAMASQKAMAGVAAAGSGLVGIFGGPLGLALTAAATGFALLGTRQDHAAIAAEKYTAAQNNFTEATRGAINETGRLTRELTKLETLKLNAAKRSAQDSIDHHLADMNEQIGALRLSSANAGNSTWDFSSIMPENIIPPSYFEELNKLMAAAKAAKVGPEELADKFTALIDKAKAAGFGNSEFVATLQKLADTRIPELAKYIEQLQEIAKVSEGAAQGARQVIDEQTALAKVTAELAAAEKAQNEEAKTGIAWLEERVKSSQSVKKAVEEEARSKDAAAIAELKLAVAAAEAAVVAAQMKQSAEGASEANNALVANATSNLQKLQAALSKYETGLADVYAGNTGGGTGSGGASKLKKALEDWKSLEQDLAKLNGTLSESGSRLEDTLNKITETGKAAGRSSQEITAMRDAYSKAFDANTLKELNRELLQLEGNTAALSALEQAEKTDAFKARLNDIRGMTQEEKDILLGRYQTAVKKDNEYKDLQTAVGFMEEMNALGASYGLSIEYQNQLIAQQAEAYATSLPASMQPYIDEWKRLQELQKSQDGWAGLERGMRKFGAEYGNLAVQVENLTMQMGNTISNTLTNAFMTGKFSAQDFFQSIVGMAAQAASNYFIGQIFSGIGGMFGSGTTPSAHGNVFSGGNLSSYSNTVVSSPTLFSYGNHLTAFASGAGLMGEAGPEAIMPLTRTSGGDLGVKVDMGNRQTGSPRVVVNLNNQTGTPMEAEAQATPDGQGGFTLDVILIEMEKGLTARAKSGHSTLTGYMEKAYGLSRAGVMSRNRR